MKLRSDVTSRAPERISSSPSISAAFTMLSPPTNFHTVTARPSSSSTGCGTTRVTWRLSPPKSGTSVVSSTSSVLT